MHSRAFTDRSNRAAGGDGYARNADRAKAYYTEKVGFNADVDITVREGLRFIQLTPPGSACSIAIGTGLADMQPGAVEGLQLVVEDIEAARAELLRQKSDMSVREFVQGLLARAKVNHEAVTGSRPS